MRPSTTDEALARQLGSGRLRAASVGAEHELLWAALDTAAAGGKRFRPALVTTTHDALGGRHPAAAVEVGAAMELLHTALVIHDDVIDEDLTRRGVPTVSGAYRARALADHSTEAGAAAYGRAAGILAGDLALVAAIRAVATCGAPPETTGRLLDLVDDALQVTTAGELSDVHLSLGTHAATLAETLETTEQKTSVYSFALPLQAGALLAEADHDAVARLGRAGREIGVSFQLLDDLLGVFGDPDRTGKSVTSDLRAGKQTPLLAFARSTGQWERIRPFVGRDLTDDELEEVRGLLSSSGSRRFVEERAGHHLATARAIVERVGIPFEPLASVISRSRSLVPGAELVA